MANAMLKKVNDGLYFIVKNTFKLSLSYDFI